MPDLFDYLKAAREAKAGDPTGLARFAPVPFAPLLVKAPKATKPAPPAQAGLGL